MFNAFEEKPWVARLRIVFWILIVAGVALVILILLRGEQLVLRAPEAYQAVFLDNGQVYFGRLRPAGKNFLSLTDIYYLREGSVQQPGSPAAGQKSLDLIKLGAELHAPKDEMIINRDHVLYYEDLSDGGEVMKLIRKHQSGK